MHEYNDRTSTLTIYTAKRASLTAYRKTPPIVMVPSCGFSVNKCEADNGKFLKTTREQGYLVSIGCEFFRHGKIDCSDRNRQVSPGFLFLCLTGTAEEHIGADPNDYVYRPENAHHYFNLDYRPSPDDILWKPYKAVLGLDRTIFYFMALDANNQLLTTTLTFPKLAFQFEFDIIYHAQNERENYICYWSPTDYPYGNHAPFKIHYELIFNTEPIKAGIARRTIEYKANPGIRSPTPIHNVRVYDREVHVLG